MFDFQQLFQDLLMRLLMQLQSQQAGGLGGPAQTPTAGPAPLGGFPFDFGRVGGNPNPFPAPPPYTPPAPAPAPGAQTFSPAVGPQQDLAQALLRTGQLQLPRGSYSAPAGGSVSFTPLGSGLGQAPSAPATKPTIGLGGLTPVTQRPMTLGPGSLDTLP